MCYKHWTLFCVDRAEWVRQTHSVRITEKKPTRRTLSIFCFWCCACVFFLCCSLLLHFSVFYCDGFRLVIYFFFYVKFRIEWIKSKPNKINEPQIKCIQIYLRSTLLNRITKTIKKAKNINNTLDQSKQKQNREEAERKRKTQRKYSNRAHWVQLIQCQSTYILKTSQWETQSMRERKISYSPFIY